MYSVQYTLYTQCVCIHFVGFKTHLYFHCLLMLLLLFMFKQDYLVAYVCVYNNWCRYSKTIEKTSSS